MEHLLTMANLKLKPSLNTPCPNGDAVHLKKKKKKNSLAHYKNKNVAQHIKIVNALFYFFVCLVYLHVWLGEKNPKPPIFP